MSSPICGVWAGLGSRALCRFRCVGFGGRDSRRFSLQGLIGIEPLLAVEALLLAEISPIG
jgi:hypothetical protein